MARSDSRAKVEDYYRQVADALIDQIERGTAPWTEAWKPGQAGLPYNIKSGRPYRGGNTVWLASTAKRRHFTDERWGTYKQIRELGGHVRRGEKGCPILFWQFEIRKLARDDRGKPLIGDKGLPVYETKPLSSPRVYRYTVFNAEQCDGLPPRTPRPRAQSWNRHEEAERVFKRSGAVIEHTGEDRAYFDLRRDRIVLPFREQFPDGPSYYQSALHELGHWTGHPSRLNRETLLMGIEHGYGSQAYAREELRAEISSMMTGDRLDIGHDPSRHASYVGSWIQQLREHPREIYRASRDAQEMSDYLLGRGRGREQERQNRARLKVSGRQRAAAGGVAGRTPFSADEPPPVVPRRRPVVEPWPGRRIARGRTAGPER